MVANKDSKSSQTDSSIALNASEPNRKHDLFQDPALARSLQEDPVATFLLANWKNLFVALLAVVGFFYLKSQIRSTTDVRVAESSETFDRARSSVMELIENQQKKAEEVKSAAAKTPAAVSVTPATQDNEKLIRSAKDSLNALKSGPEPYALLAPFYEDLLLSAEASNAEGSTAKLQAVAWSDATTPSRRVVLELQELTNAKVLLDSEASYKEGVSRLLKLAQGSTYVRAPAVLTLLRVVQSPEDISAAVSTAQDVARLFPEQADKIEVELKRLS